MIPDRPFPCKLHEQLTTKFHRLQLRSVCASLFPERPALQNSHDESIAHRYNRLDLYQRSFKLSFVCQTNSHLGVVCFMSFSDSLGLQEKGQVKTVPLCPSLSDCVPLATVLCGFFAPAVFRMLSLPNAPQRFFHTVLPLLQMPLAKSLFSEFLVVL